MNRTLPDALQISVVRPPGRPTKVKLQSPLEQSTSKIKMKIPRLQPIQKKVSIASSIEDLVNSDLFLQCETERKVETSTELRDRILAESRRISVVRPPGRPPKMRLQSPSMEQNSTPKIKMNFPRPPAIQRRDSSTSSIEDGRSPRYHLYIT